MGSTTDKEQDYDKNGYSKDYNNEFYPYEGDFNYSTSDLNFTFFENTLNLKIYEITWKSYDKNLVEVTFIETGENSLEENKIKISVKVETNTFEKGNIKNKKEIIEEAKRKVKHKIIIVDFKEEK